MIQQKKLMYFYLILFFFMLSINHGQSQKTFELKNGWTFSQTGKNQWLPATVPGTVQTDLMANGKLEDPFYGTNELTTQWPDKEDWEYKTTFMADNAMLKNDRVELDFKGLDVFCDVYLNDNLLLKSNNMFREWKADCKKLLKPGTNNLRLYFHSTVKVGLQILDSNKYIIPVFGSDWSEIGGIGAKKISTLIRKPGYQFGWDWGPRFVTMGIYRPIYLTAWSKAKIADLQYVQKEVSQHKAIVQAIFEIESLVQKEVDLEIRDNAQNKELVRKTFQLTHGTNKISLEFTLDKPKLWWVHTHGTPYLYNFKGIVKDKNVVIDEKTQNIGIRSVKIIQKPDSAGSSFYVELNGVPVFMKGADYIPNDNFLPRVSNEKYDNILSSTVDANMNCLRIWGGGFYENEVFYDLCDKKGILLWQDFMYACNQYPGNKEFLENITIEAVQNVKRLRNHASLGLWCGNNEVELFLDNNVGSVKNKENEAYLRHAYDTIFYHILPNVISEYDPSRFYWPSSPISGPHQASNSKSGDMHYWDVWHGGRDFQAYNEVIPRFCSEYGFQAYPGMKTIRTFAEQKDFSIDSKVMSQHQKNSAANSLITASLKKYYNVPSNFETFVYLSQLLQAEAIKTGIESYRRNMPYCMGSIYWQLNDCWPVTSWSGLDYYGSWKGLHYFAKKAYSEIMVSPYMSKGKLNVYIVSDRLKNTEAQLKIKLIDFSGKELFDKLIPVTITSNGSKIYFTADEEDLLKSANLASVVLTVSVLEGSQTLSTNKLYFKLPKDLSLQQPEIEKTITRTTSGYQITLSSKTLVKNLYLDTKTIWGHFSDNFFDILPNEKVVVNFKPDKLATDFEKDLTMYCVNDWNLKLDMHQ